MCFSLYQKVTCVFVLQVLVPHPLNDPTEFGSLQDLFCISRKEGCVNASLPNKISSLTCALVDASTSCLLPFKLKVPGRSEAAAGNLQEVLPVLLQTRVSRGRLVAHRDVSTRSWIIMVVLCFSTSPSLVRLSASDHLLLMSDHLD